MLELGRNNERNYLTMFMNCYCVYYMNPGRFLSRSNRWDSTCLKQDPGKGGVILFIYFRAKIFRGFVAEIRNLPN